MPTDHTITPDSADEPTYSDRDIDDALMHVLDRAEVEPEDHPEYIAGLVDGAQQLHQFLIRER